MSNDRNAGRKPIQDKSLKRMSVSITLPAWLISKINGNRSKVIENAIIKFLGDKNEVS